MLYFFIIIYLFIIIIYFEKNNNTSINDISLFILSIFVPIFGLIVTIFYNKDKKRKEKKFYEFKEEKYKKIDIIDNFLLEKYHSNFDANLYLKNYKEVRSEIINFNKLTIDESSKLYIKALHSSDTEISHMAAASLMKIKQQFEKELTLKNNINIEKLEQYILKLYEYVRNNLLDGKLKHNAIVNACNLAERIIKFKSCKLEYFIAYINLLIEDNKFDLAKDYAYYIRNKWYYNEMTWYYLFKVLLKTKNKGELQNNIIHYKNNNFEISDKMKNFILFWEANCEEEKESIYS